MNKKEIEKMGTWKKVRIRTGDERGFYEKPCFCINNTDYAIIPDKFFNILHIPTGFEVFKEGRYKTLESALENFEEVKLETDRLLKHNLCFNTKEQKRIFKELIKFNVKQEHYSFNKENLERYKKHCSERRKKSEIAYFYDTHNKRDGIIIDCEVISDIFGNPEYYECVLRNKDTQYTIQFFSGNKGMVIYKRIGKNIMYYFRCANCPFLLDTEPNKYCVIELSEIKKELVEKNWAEYENVKNHKNKNNYYILKLMKQRIVKVLKINSFI